MQWVRHRRTAREAIEMRPSEGPLAVTCSFYSVDWADRLRHRVQTIHEIIEEDTAPSTGFGAYDTGVCYTLRVVCDAKPGRAARRFAAIAVAGMAVTACGQDTDPPARTMIRFASATTGDSCVSGVTGPYIVLSEGSADCQAHAEALRGLDLGTGRTEGVLFASLPRTMGEVTVDASFCPAQQACRAVTVKLVIDTWVAGGRASGRYAFTHDGADVQGDFSASPCAYDQFVPAPRPLAGDIKVRGVKVLQGTSVTIAEAGTVTTDRNAPVVESRPALVRVFVEPRAAYSVRDIVATLTLQRRNRAPTVLEQTDRVTAPSADNNLETTFNFRIDASQMTTDLQWKVSLHEVERCTAPTGDTAEAAIPRDGTTAPLNAQSMGGAFNVVVVPFRYVADGSERLPDTSPDQLELFRERMYAKYPISALNLTVREPFGYGRRLRPRIGEDWGTLLDTLWALRSSDGAPASTYYYGMIAPADDVDDYCSEGCIEGIASVPNASDAYARGAVGLGFSGRYAEVVFTHEMGHAVGLDHAPCPPGRIFELDPNYPHPQGRIGVTGYDIMTGALLNPGRYHDIMSYCEPPWVSDYTFRAIFERLRRVNNVAAFRIGPGRRVRSAISSDRGASWGHRARLWSPFAHPVEVRFEDADGQVVEKGVADQIKISDGSVTIYWLPDVSPVGAVQVRLPSGRTLAL